MANIHTPERLEGESWLDYKARRVQSQTAVRTTVRGLTQPRSSIDSNEAAVSLRGWLRGQRTNKRLNQKRKLKRGIGWRQLKKRVMAQRRGLRPRDAGRMTAPR